MLNPKSASTIPTTSESGRINHGSSGIQTHASEEAGALNRRLRSINKSKDLLFSHC